MRKMKLTNICDFQGGSQPPKEQWTNELKDGYIRMLQIRDFTQNKNNSEYVKESNTLKTCVDDDILIARYGASVGKILTGLSGAYNVAIIKSIPDTNKVIKRYLYYYFNTDYFQNRIKNVGSRAAQAGFNKSDLEDFEINVPSLVEQQRIVDILDKSQILIKKRKKQLETLDELIKSQFIEMFGNVNTNSKGWDLTTMDKIIDVIGGYAFKSADFVDEGIPVLKIGNINSGYFKPTNLMFWEKDDKLERYLIKPGDLVISLTGTVGKDDYGNVCIMGSDYNEYYLNQRNAKLEIKSTESFNKYYLTYILKVPEIKQRLTGISRGVRQANISNKDILNLEVPNPPIELQNKFADFVNQVDKLKFKMEKSLKELEDNFNSLMQKAFKGELLK